MADVKFQLLKWQQEEFSRAMRFLVIMAGRRCGKTRFAIIRAIVKGVECTANGGSVLYVAPTQNMARVLAWDSFLEYGRPVIAYSNATHAEITLINGVKIYVRGADQPENLRGMKLWFAVLDEYKDFKSNVWPMIIRPALTDLKGGALFIGTPEPGDNLFNEIYDYAESGENPLWGARLLTTYDNELIDPEEIEEAKRTLSTAQFEQEYLANRYTTGSNVLKMEWFRHGDDPKHGDYYITIDPAGYESVADSTKKKHLDNFAISVVKVTDNGEWWVHKIDYGRWDVREASMKVLMAIRTFKPIMVGIEQGSLARALLPYLSDIMRKNGVYAHIHMIPTSGSSKINRITYALQGMMEHGRISFNVRENWDQLRREMIAFPTARAHDDLLDALSMCAHLVKTSYGRQGDVDNEYKLEVMDEICGF